MTAADALTAASAERDAYKRAKAENDERFMIERDEARAELRQERERADGEAHDARHLRSVRDGLRDDIANLEAELRQERAKVRGLGFALEGTRADRDRLHKVITEALDHDPLHGRSEGLHCGGMSPCIRGILRAALDKDGKP